MAIVFGQAANSFVWDNLSGMETGTGTGTEMENGNPMKFKGGFGVWVLGCPQVSKGDVSGTGNGKSYKLLCIIGDNCHYCHAQAVVSSSSSLGSVVQTHVLSLLYELYVGSQMLCNLLGHLVDSVGNNRFFPSRVSDPNMALLGPMSHDSNDYALLCYWITSNLFTVSYGLAIKQHEVRKLLDLPESPIPPAPQPQPCSASAFQQHNTAKEESKQSPDSSKVANRRISKDAILRQRIRNLEKQLKGRKSNKNQ